MPDTLVSNFTYWIVKTQREGEVENAFNHIRSIQVIGLAFGLIGTVILALGYFDSSERRTETRMG